MSRQIRKRNNLIQNEAAEAVAAAGRAVEAVGPAGGEEGILALPHLAVGVEEGGDAETLLELGLVLGHCLSLFALSTNYSTNQGACSSGKSVRITNALNHRTSQGSTSIKRGNIGASGPGTHPTSNRGYVVG